MGVRNLLFVEPLADDGGALFESQRALAAALIEVKGGGFESKDPDNLRIFVGQVLKRYGEPGSRPLSRNLRRSLPQAIAKRIKDPVKAKEVAEAVITGIDRMKNASSYSSPLADAQEWEQFLAASCDEQFKHVVIITAEPAEVQHGSVRANELTDALINRAIDRDQDAAGAGAVFDFFLPSQAIAETMRIGLIARVASQLGCEMAAAAEKVDGAQREGRLNIYHIEDCPYFANTCVFDPGLPRTQAYHLYYHEEGKVSVAVLNRRGIDNWFERFFSPIYLTRSRYTVRPFGLTQSIADRGDLAHLAAA
jgi:hypothetical protein